MKLSTSTLFKHSLFAPKGFKFDITKMDEIKDVINKFSSIELIDKNRVLQWVELHQNTCHESEDWLANLKAYLIQSDSW